MDKPYVSAHVSLIGRRYDPKLLSEHLNCDNQLAHDVALPLFKNGVQVAAMTCRKSYHCDPANPMVPEPRNHHSLILLLQGELTVHMNNEERVMKSGDLAYCPPETTFGYKGKKGSVSWWLYFKLADDEYWDPLKRNDPYVRAYESADLMFLLLRRLLDAYRKKDLKGLSIARGDAHMLLTVLSRLRYADSTDELSERLKQVVEQIATHPSKPWTVNAIARTLNVSERVLFRLFKKQYGCSPVELVIRQRLNMAVQHLTETQEPISAIALHCGYKSVYSFTRLFHKHIGMPPAEYRKRS